MRAWRRDAGADVLFAPPVQEVYPDGFATAVEVAGVSQPLEGEWRGAAHFRGVATIVTKLLCMALPDVAYFGRKDAQQLLVIRRLVADLNLPVRIAAVPTVREADGLALSSRNRLLSGEQREQALGIPRALARARERAGRRRRALCRGLAGVRPRGPRRPRRWRPSTWRWSTPTAWRRWASSTGRACC